MAQILKVPGSKLTSPVPTIDPVLARGSLVLLDPTHPAQSWASGVPATVPNIANTAFIALTGNGAPTSSLSSSFTNPASGPRAGLTDRSLRGGLNVIASQTAGVQGQAMRINWPEAVKQYITANPSHHYSMVLHHRITRVTNAAFVPIMRAVGDRVDGNGVSVGTAQGAIQQGNGIIGAVPPSGNARRLGFDTTALAGVTGLSYSGLGWVSGEQLDALMLNIGPVGGKYSAGSATSVPSAVIYRAYVEDLTISGRTHAEVFAIEQAMNTALFTGTGRYASDSFTPVANVP